MKKATLLILMPLVHLFGQTSPAPATNPAGDVSTFVVGATPTDAKPKATSPDAVKQDSPPAVTTPEQAPATDTSPSPRTGELPDEILAADNNARITRHGDGYAYSFDHVPMGVVCACLAKAFHWTVIYTGNDAITFTGSGEISNARMLPYIVVNGTSLFVTGNGDTLQICPNKGSGIPTTTLKELSSASQQQ